jgi:hypothetical protein
VTKQYIRAYAKWLKKVARVIIEMGIDATQCAQLKRKKGSLSL